MFSWGRSPRRRALSGAAALLVSMGALPLASEAGAATRAVDCRGGAGDIERVQSAVDDAAAGDTVALTGTCDFSAAAPHGGDDTSVASAAVVVRSPGVSIQSASGTRATVVGDGSEAAFVVLPGAAGSRIGGLGFVNVARAVVVLGADGVSVVGNEVTASTSADMALGAIANGSATTVTHGPSGSAGSEQVVAGAVRDLEIAGNRISVSGTGLGDPPFTGVGVHQSDGGVVEGVAISDNRITMLLATYRSSRTNAIRVEAHDAGTGGGAAQDFSVRGVAVVGNAVGTGGSGGDPDAIPAGGRIAIVLQRVGDFEVSGNRVRAHAGAGSDEPAGGIVTADSSLGSVHANRVVVSHDPGAAPSVLGGIAAIDGLAALGGDLSADQHATGVDVLGNTVGDLATPTAPAIAVSGVDLATVADNTLRAGSGDALHVGLDRPAPVGTAGTPLPSTVTRSVLCANQLDGVDDDPGEVSFSNRATDAPSTNNNFPGGAGHGTGNRACTVTVAGSPRIVGVDEDLVVTGLALASRPVAVTVTDEAGASLARATTAASDGSYAVTVTSAAIAAFADGMLRLDVSAGDPGVFTLDAAPTQVLKDTEPNDGTGTVLLADGDGSTNLNEAVAGVPIAWRQPSTGNARSARLSVADADGNVPAECGPFELPPDGNGKIAGSCLLVLPEGPYTFSASWLLSDGSRTPVARSQPSVKDTKAEPPSILTPSEGEIVDSSLVTVSGSAEPGSALTLRDFPERAVVATTTVASDGTWSVTVELADGDHQVTAAIVDPAGNQSGGSPLRSFSVDTSPPDTTAPAAPVLTSPADGSVHPGRVDVAGTAEPDATVEITVDASATVSVPVASDGRWGGRISLQTGTHTITAVAVDAAGNRSAPTDPVSVVVDATAPTVDIDEPTPDRIHAFGERVVVSGRAADNWEVDFVGVEILDFRARGVVRAGVEAACTGCGTASATWSFEPDPALPPGVYHARAVAFDGLGNRASAVVRFVVAVP